MNANFAAQICTNTSTFILSLIFIGNFTSLNLYLDSSYPELDHGFILPFQVSLRTLRSNKRQYVSFLS